MTHLKSHLLVRTSVATSWRGGGCTPSLKNNDLGKLCLSSLIQINFIFKLNIYRLFISTLGIDEKSAQGDEKSTNIYLRQKIYIQDKTIYLKQKIKKLSR